MATTLNSLDNILSQSANKGNWPVFWQDLGVGTTTAATTSCGYVTAQRYPRTISLPTLGSGVTGAYLTYCRAASATASTDILVCLEYLLGTLTVSGNSYSDGSAMPTKTIRGTSVTTAASEIFAVVTTTLTATTPVLTFNYTDQDGNTGASGSITLPTNAAVGSAFRLNPHLASGDTGIRDLSASSPNGLSISTGSAGVIKVYGVLPLWKGTTGLLEEVAAIDPLAVSEVPYLIESTDTVAVYRYGTSSQTLVKAAMNFVPSD